MITYTNTWTSFVLSILLLCIRDCSSAVISGRVIWGDTRQGMHPALVQANDNDVSGSDRMGESWTTSDGRFSITYDSSRIWDRNAIGTSDRPDPILTVLTPNGFGGYITWGRSQEYLNINGDLTGIVLSMSRRNITGTVKWPADGWQDSIITSPSGAFLGWQAVPVSGAVVTAWDNDPIGRDFMGLASTQSDGSFALSYSSQNAWDAISPLPDIILEVAVDGNTWLATPERLNVGSSINVGDITLPRIVVNGSLKFIETCQGAVGVSVIVKDDDPVGSETMGSIAITNARTGIYTIFVNPQDGGTSDWDSSGDGTQYPDVFSNFERNNGITLWRTPVVRNFQTTLLRPAIQQGDNWVSNGAPLPPVFRTITSNYELAAASVVSGAGVSWLTSSVYLDCTPKQIVITMYVDFEKDEGVGGGDDYSNEQYDHLKEVAKAGISRGWSRSGDRAVTVGGERYNVFVDVVEDPRGLDIEIEVNKGATDCGRSNNFVIMDIALVYNEGCARAANAATWQRDADYQFRYAAAHEIGHSILALAPPRRAPDTSIDSDFLPGAGWSLTHKGTSSVFQSPSDSAPEFPATGEADIMLYYNNSPKPPNWLDMQFATEEDVLSMVALSKKKYGKTRTCGGCRAQFPPPPPPRNKPAPRPSKAPFPAPSSTKPYSPPPVPRINPSPPPPFPDPPSPSPSPPPPEPVPSPPPPSPEPEPEPKPTPKPTPDSADLYGWTPHKLIRNWVSVAASSDGSKMYGVSYGVDNGPGEVYGSSDAGKTWTNLVGVGSMSFKGRKLKQVDPGWRPVTIATSADGTRLIMGMNNLPDATMSGAPIWTSSNGGKSWEDRKATSGLRLWTSVASASNGLKLAAVSAGLNAGVLTSDDGGANWVEEGQPQLYWTSISSSSDGATLLACASHTPTTTGAVYKKIGKIWTDCTPPGASSRTWTAVAMSSTGSLMVAAESSGGMFISKDKGGSWIEFKLGRSWKSVSCSGDGSRLIAVDGTGMYTSLDSGKTWTRTAGKTLNLVATAVSATGSKSITAVSVGDIYTL